MKATHKLTMNFVEKLFYHEDGEEIHCTKCHQTLMAGKKLDPLALQDCYLKHKYECPGEPIAKIIEEDEIPF
jgi:hypothetical protein